MSSCTNKQRTKQRICWRKWVKLTLKLVINAQFRYRNMFFYKKQVTISIFSKTENGRILPTKELTENVKKLIKESFSMASECQERGLILVGRDFQKVVIKGGMITLLFLGNRWSCLVTNFNNGKLFLETVQNSKFDYCYVLQKKLQSSICLIPLPANLFTGFYM